VPVERTTSLLLLAIGLALAALLLATNWVAPYELFHDELYYWAGAMRPGLGYVDHPPLAPWILGASVALLGDGLLGFALVPAVCAAGTVVLTGWIARSLGAGRFGQLLAGLSVAVVPTFLVFFSFYSVNAIELLLWAGASFVLAELLRSEEPRLWLVFGALVGAAFLDKHTVLLFAFGVGVGILATPARSGLATRWPWLGALLALAIALPNLYWNLVQDWPSLAFYQTRGEGIIDASVLDVLVLQLVSINPMNLLLWLPGLLYLLFAKAARPYRALGIAFTVLFVVILLAGQRRVDRMAGAYPMVLAAGATLWDSWRPRGKIFLRGGLAAALLASGILVLPPTIPVLSPEGVARYFEAIGQKPEIEVGDVGTDIPLWLTGRLEWQRFAAQVMDVWQGLPADERERAAVLTPHWVYAAVIEYYARDGPRPPVVSPHNAYYFWRGEAAGRDVVISVGVRDEILSRYFAGTRDAGTFRCTYCPSFRPDLPIRVSSGPVRPLEELLEEWRFFGIMPAPALIGDAGGWLRENRPPEDSGDANPDS
jgi:hypothetical protein